MITKQAPSYHISIYCTGEKVALYAAIQSVCDSIGLCVSIFPCDYLFTGGMESGYEIRLINYPRFPSTKEAIKAKAMQVVEAIFTVNPKGSLTMVDPWDSVYMSERDCDCG